MTKVLFILAYLDFPTRTFREIQIWIIGLRFEFTVIYVLVFHRRNNLGLHPFHWNLIGSKMQKRPF